MKRVPMTSRDRRALLLGLIIAIPAVLVPLVVQPYLRVLSTYHQETVDERARLAQEQGIIADLPIFPATRRTVSHQLEREVSRLFQASNDLVATGDLAQYVERVAKANGVQLQQTETRPTHPVLRDLQALQLEVHAEGDLDGILHFLHQLEIGDKLVRVADLTIDAGRGTLDTSRVHGVEVLSISANICGYRLIGAQWQSIETRDDGASSPFTRVASSNASLDAVLNHDPFNPARTRPSPSYRLAMLQRGQPVRQRKQPPHFHLIGTVTSVHDANFAMIQEESGTPPQTVSVGERIGDYTLIAIRRDVAVLTAHDGIHLELRADEAGVFPSDDPLSVNGQSGVSIRIEKDSTGTFQVARALDGGRGGISMTGPGNDSVYAQVNGPTGWGGDTGKFLLATDGQGHCCKSIQMTQPGNYVYQIWDKNANAIRQGTIVMEQP